jgi:hypothetical protein
MRSMRLQCLCLALLLAISCSILKPGQHLIERDVWEVDVPAFHFQRLEWRHIHGSDAYPRLARLCSVNAPGETIEQAADRWMAAGHIACSVRIVEGGHCVVTSLLSEDRAKTFPERSGESLYNHELRHCGIGMPTPGGWRHLR